MNQTAMPMNMVPVAGVREGIAAGHKATWASAPADTTQEAALAQAVAGNEAFPAVNTPEWDAMNERRAELIRKDLDEGLNPAERQEYERLQRMSLAAAVKAFPRPNPDFEELARLRKELRAPSVPVTE
jgi:hypothetical protein